MIYNMQSATIYDIYSIQYSWQHTLLNAEPGSAFSLMVC
jgi:hypothetical protein